MYKYGIAQSETEKHQVLKLLKKIYTREGYISSEDSENPFDKYLLEPETVIFTGHINDNLFATVSLVPDSATGLPMDILYHEELGTLRASGKKIAEVTQFAVDHEIIHQNQTPDGPKQSLSATAPLLKSVLAYALANKFDYLCITNNPKHDSFYKQLGFVQIGGLKYYPAVNNAPALAQVLDIRNLDLNNLPGILK